MYVCVCVCCGWFGGNGLCGSWDFGMGDGVLCLEYVGECWEDGECRGDGECVQGCKDYVMHGHMDSLLYMYCTFTFNFY